MQMRPDIQIKSILKALNDVVLPAIDPVNQLAQEQARLCMGLLDLMSRQLPLQFRFDVDELRRLASLGEAMVETDVADRASGPAQMVRTDLGKARDVLARALADPSEVLAAVRAMRASTSALVQQACGDEAGADSGRIERLVLDASREQLLRDRSWLLAQRWEPDPDAIPAIEALLAPDEDEG